MTGAPPTPAASVALRPADADALLAVRGLPLDGFRVEDAVVAETGVAGTATAVLVGVAALERRGRAALLRSVAVVTPGRGVGAALVRHLLARADAEGRPVALLTTTAEGSFSRFGFARVAREDVPSALLATAGFRGACPASAMVMLPKPAARRF